MSPTPGQPKLGRLYAPDPRDSNYPARAKLPERVEVPTYRYWWNRGARLDQGRTGTCVGHAWAHLAENGPETRAPRSPFAADVDPFDWYRKAVLIDEWDDNDREANAPRDQLQFGTSIRAGAKVGVSLGLIGEYRWAWDLDTVVNWILTKGPVVLGTNWYQRMFNYSEGEDVPEPWPNDSPVGGHAYLLDGANVRTERARIYNSWRGAHVGWMSFKLIERLLGERGEACMATELPDAA